MPRLTERFYRVDAGRSRSAGGTGLGLAIVKHIVNRHRGQLLIESEAGAGAAFRVWLPGRLARRGRGGGWRRGYRQAAPLASGAALSVHLRC